MEELKFLVRFPFLLRTSPGEYSGIYHSEDTSYRIQFSCPEMPLLTGSHLHVDTVDNVKKELLFSADKHMDAIQLMQGLVDQLQRSPPIFNIRRQQEIYAQLKNIQDKCSFELSDDHQRVTLKDIPNYPGHYMELQYSEAGFQLIGHSLPTGCRSVIGKTLSEYLLAFEQEMTNLQEFFSNCDDIDELCFVIAGRSKDAYRIFKFNEKVFLKVTFDPYVPSNVQLNFIGPLEEVTALRHTYLQRIGDWDPDLNAYKNLLRMFDLLYFPYRPDPSNPDNKSCGICLEVELEGHYPIITCFNANCEVVFHASCLSRWFQTSLDSKVFCTVASGECPYCKQKLTMFVDLGEQQQPQPN